MALLTRPKWINTWLVEQFAQWLAGGPEMATNAEAMLASSAIVFGAIESQRQGAALKLGDYLAAFG